MGGRGGGKGLITAAHVGYHIAGYKDTRNTCTVTDHQAERMSSGMK